MVMIKPQQQREYMLGQSVITSINFYQNGEIIFMTPNGWIENHGVAGGDMVGLTLQNPVKQKSLAKLAGGNFSVLSTERWFTNKQVVLYVDLALENYEFGDMTEAPLFYWNGGYNVHDIRKLTGCFGSDIPQTITVAVAGSARDYGDIIL